MEQRSDIMAFLQETIQRMAAKSPVFFQVYQAIGKYASLITGIPLFLQQIQLATGMSISLPEVVNSWVIRAIFWAGVVMWWMAKMPVKDPSKPTDKNDNELPKSQVMPFTVQKQNDTQYGPDKK